MKTFQIICFLALMDHHGEGWHHASPHYLEEKKHLLEVSEEVAFAQLDQTNQQRVIHYCRIWRVTIPSVVLKYIEDFREYFE